VGIVKVGSINCRQHQFVNNVDAAIHSHGDHAFAMPEQGGMAGVDRLEAG
jgi:hypothetical protein